MESSNNSPSSAFVYAEPVILNVEDKRFFFSRKITVKRISDGTQLFKIEDEGMGFSSFHKNIQDMQGNVLYKNQNVAFSWRGRMNISRMSSNGDIIAFHLREKSACSCECEDTILVWKGASDAGEPWVSISGNLERKKFEFEEVSTGKTIAVVSRKSNAEGRPRRDSKFFITVEPGYNVALISFLAIVLYLRADAQRRSAQAQASYASV